MHLVTISLSLLKQTLETHNIHQVYIKLREEYMTLDI